MANTDNLMPIQEVNSRRSREQHSEDSRKGGIASGEARKRKKTMKEQAELLLSLPIKDEKIIQLLNAMGVEEDDINYQTALLISLLQKGVKKGDKNIVEFFRDTVDGKPKETVEINGNIDATIKEIDDYLCKKKKN